VAACQNASMLPNTSLDRSPDASRVSQLDYPVATAPGTDLYMIAAAGQLNRSALSVQNPDPSE
jgi:hypothetical protein